MPVPAPLSFKLLHAYGRVATTERGGFRLARLARRFVPRARWSGRFDVGGLTYGLDLSTYPDVAMAGGVYELDTLRVLRRRLGPGTTFIDGGANLGYFTCQAAVWGAKVVAVEPDPVNRERLTTNLAANGLSDRVGRSPPSPSPKLAARRRFIGRSRRRRPTTASRAGSRARACRASRSTSSFAGLTGSSRRRRTW